METTFCWPYEELKVTKLEKPQSFLFETPWYSSVIETTAEGAALFEKAFSEEATQSPAELLDLYSKVLTPTLGSPFSYILAQSQMNVAISNETSSSLTEEDVLTPKTFASAVGMSDEFLPTQWSWDVDSLLEISQVPGTKSYSPMSLYSAFLRFFYLEATTKDQTMSLYRDLPTVCKTVENTQSALAYLISQNLQVTKRCESVLTAALKNAGANEGRLEDFIEAEQGHDKIMSHALKAFPETALKDWTLCVHPSTNALMDSFHVLAEHSFMSFAFAICLFERPQFEEVHPVTRMLNEVSLEEAAKRYERHHTINETGNHDQIGFDMISAIPLLTKREATVATRLCEAFSVVMTSHSANLLKQIQSKTI